MKCRELCACDRIRDQESPVSVNYQKMGADLYSAGLLVRHELSSSAVAMPHEDDEEEDKVVFNVPKVENSELVKDIFVDSTSDPAPSPQHQTHHHHHNHHHNSVESIKMAKEIGTDYNFKRQIVWFNAIGFLVLHLCGCYGVYLMFTRAKILTTIYGEKEFSDLESISNCFLIISQPSGWFTLPGRESQWVLIDSGLIDRLKQISTSVPFFCTW